MLMKKKTPSYLFFFGCCFVLFFFLNTTQMTSKFSGTVAGFNDILQILVNISAASHFHFLRNTRLSTICSWWFTALELLKLFHNFLLRDFNFCYKATLISYEKCPWKRNFLIILCDEDGHRKFNLIFLLFCFFRRGWSHGWVACGSRGLTGGFCFLQGHFLYTFYSALYICLSD